MAKVAGAWTITVDDADGSGQDISNDVGSVDVDTPRTLVDVTGVDKTANERLATLIDGTVTLSGFYNAAANKSHAVFSTVTSDTDTRTCVFGLPGSQTLTMEMLCTNYALKYQNGQTTWTVNLQLANGTAPAWS